jgi:hypothetical protein
MNEEERERMRETKRTEAASQEEVATVRFWREEDDILSFVESVRNVCVWIPNSGHLAFGKGAAWELKAPSLVGRASGVPALSWGRIRKGVHGTESNATFANAKGATTLISIKLTVVLTPLSLDTGKPV